MSRSRITALSVDMTVVHEIIARLRAGRRSIGFWRHLQSLIVDGCAIELHDPLPGSGFDVRAVPSIQLVRLLCAHRVFE